MIQEVLEVPKANPTAGGLLQLWERASVAARAGEGGKKVAREGGRGGEGRGEEGTNSNV